MDITEWGAYGQIILMNMQTIDGDEFILDRVYQAALLQQQQMGRHGESLCFDAPDCPTNM
eukprot:3377627-Heterocapsa_arctica.AAC.1